MNRGCFEHRENLSPSRKFQIGYSLARHERNELEAGIDNNSG